MGFPVELKGMKRWVGYRLVPDKDGGKPRKVPINAVTGKNAQSNNPDTWTDYETAKAAAEQYGYNGIGFMFLKDDGFVGVDIDHCYDPATNTFNEVATAIMAKQPTYMEFSPSGDGVHVWFKGTKPKGPSKNTNTGVEMYDSVRYFTVTERQVPGTLDIVAEALPDTLPWIMDTYLAKPKAKKKKQSKTGEKLSDEDIIEKASAAGNGELFTDLMEGKWQEHYPSQSEADMALCLKLAFWSGKDKAQMDRMFRASGLFREKWDQQHHADGSTYGEETLSRAIEMTESVYTTGNDTPIFEYEGKYFRSRGDQMYPITNFVLHPIEMIQSEDETQLTAEFVTPRGESFTLTFMTTDLANQQKFKNLLSSRTISLGWFGGDGDLELFKGFVSYLDWPMKTGVKAMGIYEFEGRYVFASADGSIDAKGELVEDIVQLERYKSIESGILKTDLLTAEKMKELGSLLLGYNEPAKVISILAWVAGCFVKPHLRMSGIKFPHLFLIGEAGSGKSTTMEKVILPVFSADRVTAATQVTPFTLMKESASSNMVPMALDEFKPSRMDRLKLNALHNQFRDAFDMHAGVRGRADQTMIAYKLLAPMVVAGEESAEEAAIRERSIELLFSKKDIKKPEYAVAFSRISANADMLGDLGRSLLMTALSTQASEVEHWYKDVLPKFAKELPSRVVNNLACCFCGLKLVQKLCTDLRLDWDEVFPFQMGVCMEQLQFGAREYLLDGGMSNKSVVEQTFEVISRMGLIPRNDYILTEDRTLLYIPLTRIYDDYTKYRKDHAILGEVLTYSQFRKQLIHSDIMVEGNVQKKFNGVNSRCFVINYKLLLERGCEVSGFETDDVPPLE